MVWFSFRGKNVVIFGVSNSSSVNTNNKKNNILVLSEGPTQRLNDATVTAEAKYSINFSISGRKLCLSLNYNENSIFFVC